MMSFIQSVVFLFLINGILYAAIPSGGNSSFKNRELGNGSVWTDDLGDWEWRGNRDHVHDFVLVDRSHGFSCTEFGVIRWNFEDSTYTTLRLGNHRLSNRCRDLHLSGDSLWIATDEVAWLLTKDSVFVPYMNFKEQGCRVTLGVSNARYWALLCEDSISWSVYRFDSIRWRVEKGAEWTGINQPVGLSILDGDSLLIWDQSQVMRERKDSISTVLQIRALGDSIAAAQLLLSVWGDFTGPTWVMTNRSSFYRANLSDAWHYHPLPDVTWLVEGGFIGNQYGQIWVSGQSGLDNQSWLWYNGNWQLKDYLHPLFVSVDSNETWSGLNGLMKTSWIPGGSPYSGLSIHWKINELSSADCEEELDFRDIGWMQSDTVSVLWADSKTGASLIFRDSLGVCRHFSYVAGNSLSHGNRDTLMLAMDYSHGILMFYPGTLQPSGVYQKDSLPKIELKACEWDQSGGRYCIQRDSLLIYQKNSLWDTLTAGALSMISSTTGGVWIRYAEGWEYCDQAQCSKRGTPNDLWYPYIKDHPIPDKMRVTSAAGNQEQMVVCGQKSNQNKTVCSFAAAASDWFDLEINLLEDSLNQVRLDPLGRFWFLTSRGALVWKPLLSLTRIKTLSGTLSKIQMVFVDHGFQVRCDECSPDQQLLMFHPNGSLRWSGTLRTAPIFPMIWTNSIWLTP